MRDPWTFKEGCIKKRGNGIKFTGKWNRPKRKCGLGKEKIMKEFKYVITDKEGIHMRPAGELVKAAKQFESSILIKKDGKTADCKKVFTIMSLAVKCGQEVTVKVEGSDEEQAAAKIEEFMKANM